MSIGRYVFESEHTALSVIPKSGIVFGIRTLAGLSVDKTSNMTLIQEYDLARELDTSIT